jgi:cytochrome c
MNTEAAANPDFKYSKGMIAAAEGGLVWNAENMTAFLTKPKALVKGTKMGFAGLRKEADIENIMAYLATFE